MTDSPAVDAACAALTALRETVPLVSCLTNTVVKPFTANVLLAVGATPAMVDIPGEAGDFAAVASAVLINLGTPTAEQREAMAEAVAGARAAGTPWVLDPVAVGALKVRTALAHELLAERPAIIRGNASEIMALGGDGAGGRGVDATDRADAALPAARSLATRTGAVVAVSGPVDLITDGTVTVRVGGGDVLLTKVTGGGCALGGVMGAFCATAPDALSAAVAASTVYAVAAELAAADSAGPGTFAVQLLDALAKLDADTLAARAQVS